MITRIEIDGFKTFENFGLDLHPFTAIVGPNASGKSNLFDAINFVCDARPATTLPMKAAVSRFSSTPTRRP